MSDKSPAFQFYPSDWLSDEKVIAMTPAQEGFYIRAICLCWRQGSIPSDNGILALLLAKGPSQPTEVDLRVVKACFNGGLTDSGRMVHLRLEEEREKQLAWAEKSSRGGKISAEVRKLNGIGKKKNGKGGSSVVERWFNSSSSSSDLKKEDTLGSENDGNGVYTPPENPTRLQALEIEFERARAAYPGTKRGHDVEWANFKKKFTMQMAGIVPTLFEAITNYSAYLKSMGTEKQYIAHFQTWVNQQRWTAVYPGNLHVNGLASEKKPFYDPMNP